MRVAVVIPYFQRKPGILRRAVDSVLAQELPGSVAVELIIVDDESPLTPQQDLGDLDLPPPFTVVMLKRSNGGPGAARNTALDSLDPAETDYVAFLDSDDVWFPGHLREALRTLADGADFYFANSMHDGVTSFSYFEYMTRNHDVGVGAESERRSISGRQAFDEIAGAQHAGNFTRPPVGGDARTRDRGGGDRGDQGREEGAWIRPSSCWCCRWRCSRSACSASSCAATCS